MSISGSMSDAINRVSYMLVTPQPQIPEGVDDLHVFCDNTTNPDHLSYMRVWVIQSDGKGVDHWAKERKETWQMPDWMVETSRPDSIEYWRQLYPGDLPPGARVTLKQLPTDKLWYWKIWWGGA